MEGWVIGCVGAAVGQTGVTSLRKELEFVKIFVAMGMW
jgi:hypothetical protein